METQRDETYKEFRERILKIREHRTAMYSQSIYTRDLVRKAFKRNPSLHILKEKEYTDLVGRINEMLVEEFCKTGSVVFPYQMGEIVLYKRKNRSIPAKTKERKKQTVWDKTLKYWYENPEAYEKKICIRNLPKEYYHICYTQRRKYINRKFFHFIPTKELKHIINEYAKTYKDIISYEHRIYNA